MMKKYWILSYFVMCSQVVFTKMDHDTSDQQNSDFMFQGPNSASNTAYGNDMYRNPPMFRMYGVSDANSTASTVTGSADLHVSVRIQLMSYINQYLQLPGGMTCVCPDGYECAQLSNKNEAKCVFSFTVLVSSPGNSVQYVSSEFIPLSTSGSPDISGLSPQEANFWNSPHEFRLKSKPSAIDVFVHHMGLVLTQTGGLAKTLSVVHVDSFSQSLSDIVPSVAGIPQVREVQLTGSILGTRLALAYSILCIGGFQGPNCDLTCNASEANSAVAVCKSNTTGFFYTCSYSESNQIQNCQPCPWGIAKNSYCQDLNGGVLNPSVAQVVPTGFRTATIVLGVLSSALLIFLIIVTIYSCVLMNRRIHEEDVPGHNYRSSLRTEGNANRPLLQAGYRAQSQSSQNDLSQRLPTAAPHSVPPLDAVPAKSSLRKTNYIPPAHLGGGSSLNDSLNSSFASSVPMPPSREADV